MIKLTIFLTRKADTSHEQFVSYWKNEHVPLVRQVPEVQRLVRRYVLQHADPEPIEGVPTATYDGYAELWFDNHDDLAEALRSEMYLTSVAEDLTHFTHPSLTRLLVTEEHSVI